MTAARTGPAVVALQTRRAGQLVLVVGLACTAAGAVVVGASGAWAGLVATAAVLGFFVAGAAPVLRGRAFESNPGLGMAVVLVGYGARLVLVALLAFLVALVVDLHSRTLGLTVMACAVAWVLGSAVVALRGHVPLDVPEHGTPGAGA